MSRQELLKKYKNKICVFYQGENGEVKIKWFTKLSKCFDFCQSGVKVQSIVNLKLVKREEHIVDFLDSLLFEDYEL